MGEGMKHVDVIERLQRIRNFYRDTIEDYTAVEAVDMAISALKKAGSGQVDSGDGETAGSA